MFVGHKGDKIMPLTVDLKNHSHRRSVYSFLGIVFAAREMEGFTFFTESWVRNVKQADDESAEQMIERAMKGPPPSEAFDRIDVLSVMMVWRDANGDRQADGWAGEIIRDARNKPTGTRDLFVDEADEPLLTAQHSIDGVVVDIFPPRPMVGVKLDAAREMIRVLGPALMKRLGIKEISHAD
jgi:hypothetical protein